MVHFLILTLFFFTSTLKAQPKLENLSYAVGSEKYDLSSLKNQKYTLYDSVSYRAEGSTPIFLKFDIINKNHPSDYFFYIHYMLCKELDVYFILKDTIIHQYSSINQPLEQKIIKINSTAIPIPCQDDTIHCYAKFFPFWNNYLKLPISNTNKLLKDNIQNKIVQYIFIGITLLSIVFSILLFLFLKDKTYLYFLLYSVAALFTRLVHIGDILQFIHSFFTIYRLENLFALYSITYVSVTICTLLFFKKLLSISIYSPRLNFYINLTIILRCVLLFINTVIVQKDFISFWGLTFNINHRILDQLAVSLLLPMLYISFQKERKMFVFSLFSILIVLSGHFINFASLTIFNDSYSAYLNFASLEIVLLISMLGYKYYLLKLENENALKIIIEKMKENESIKDTINRELEQKVAERTEEIKKMNEVLAKHNHDLTHEVEDLHEARLFQKKMGYSEFSKIFPTDESCFSYLADLKWPKSKKFKCLKCGYAGFQSLPNNARRCQSCSYVESATIGTLFHNVKFPLQKAFYITYLTGTNNTDKSIEESAGELNMRPATYWTFKHKIQEFIKTISNQPKAKDGWTHLIQYSIQTNKKLSKNESN